MKTKVLMLFVFVLVLIPMSTKSFAEESFDGDSSVDPPLSEVVAGQSSVMNIRFLYTSGPYAMNNFTPVIEVNPSSARELVQVDVDPIDITQGQIKRIPITLTVDPYIKHEKIFLSISYTGHHFMSGNLQKSSWNDMVELDVKGILVPEPEPPYFENIDEEKPCGLGTIYQDGICVVDKIENSTETSTDPSKRWGGPYTFDGKSPLKQFKSGVSFDEIQCNDNLVLLQKHNGSPACVKPDSVIDLIKRNWLLTEDVGGYAIDYDGDVKHLPFADVCTNEMKIILLTHSNIASTDEEFVIDTVELPFGMNQEDFERCAHETSFTKSRWNMVTMENPEKEIMKKAKELRINNIMQAVDSEELSYDEKKEYIKIRYEESPNQIPSLNIRIKDFDRHLEFGERPTFTVIETGYASTCTSSKLEVYYLKNETGYDLKTDELIYENKIVYPCPEPTSLYFPILKFWDDTDFEPFPACDKTGRYLVVGDSGYERMPLEEYYCGIENEN